jgi:iron transport multicopper oxidase
VLEWCSTNLFLPEDTVITLADWYHYVSSEAPTVPCVVISCRSSDARQSSKCVQFHPDQRKRSLLRRSCRASRCCKRCTGKTVSVVHIASVRSTGPHTSHRNSYRFRIVSISCDPSYNFSIDSHQLTVIEVDGNSVQPLVVDSIHIYAGEQC